MRRTVPALAPARARALVPALLVAAGLTAASLAGCAGGASDPGASGTPASGSPSGSAATARAAAADPADCAGVFVTVQFGLLGASDIDACAKTSTAITAADALKAVKVTTEGTQKYGDEVVCRVNGEPSASKPIEVPGQAAYIEKCQGMPAAFAYWAVWVRDSASGQWDYAQNGIGTEQLQPGQTLGLKFTTGTDTTPPTSAASDKG